MASFLRTSALCALIVLRTASAFRVTNADKRVGSSEPPGSLGPPVPVDITEHVAVADGDDTARCCCDAHAAGLHIGWSLTNTPRSGICIVVTVDTADFHCADLGRHARIWQTGVLHHYTRTVARRCTIDEAEARDCAILLQHKSPRPDYCRPVLPVAQLQSDDTEDGALVAVPAAALGGSSAVSCEDGFAPGAPIVSCVVDGVGEGAFSPAPNCTRLMDYCAEVNEDSAQIAGAAVGNMRVVQCTGGLSAKASLVTCGNDGLFHPGPACIRNNLFDVTVRAAEVEASGVGRCCCDMPNNGGFASMTHWLTDMFSPSEHTNKCVFVFEVDHCRQIGGRNHWIHYTRSKKQHCVVEELEFQHIMDAYPAAQDWMHDAQRVSN